MTYSCKYCGTKYNGHPEHNCRNCGAVEFKKVSDEFRELEKAMEMQSLGFNLDGFIEGLIRGGMSVGTRNLLKPKTIKL